MKNPKRRTMVVRVTDEQREALWLESLRRGTSFSQIIREALEYRERSFTGMTHHTEGSNPGLTMTVRCG